MLTMTEAAAGYLSDVLEGANASRETAVRLEKKGNSFAPSLDTSRPGDVTIARNGRNVLVMDADTSEVLTERKLDVHATSDGLRLRLT